MVLRDRDGVGGRGGLGRAGGAEGVTPELSVVVPSVNGWLYLGECLEALRAESVSGVALEVLVVDRCGAAVRENVRRECPDAVVIETDPRTSIPIMRAIAFARATAAAVAVIEDHVLVPRGWARQMLNALAGGPDAVGGIVRNAATDRLVDRAAFLCEYSHLLPPLRSGPSRWLTGNNVVYRRAVLERYGTTLAEGRWEDALHDAMLRDGLVLLCRPEIVVAHKRHFRAVEYLSQRYLYARGYAGQRRAPMSALARTTMGVATLGLPPILLFRIVSRVASRRMHQAQFVECLPFLFVAVCAWALGECVGYLAGPGDAMSRVT
jgi:hypothetical protein